MLVGTLLVIGVTSAVIAHLRSAPSDRAETVRPEPSEAPGREEGAAEDEHTAESEAREAADITKARAVAFDAARAGGLVGLQRPLRSVPLPGWTTEHVWSATNDDWEPAIAADPNAPYVYALATRYTPPRRCHGCELPSIILRVSADGGRTWGPDRFLCRCPDITNGEYDPIIEVDGEGTVHAVWLQGYSPGVVYSRSSDHGTTWTTPIPMPVAWSDKPQLAVSADGQDVYVDMNGPSHGDSLVAVSHDGGGTFTLVRVTDDDRYHFAGGAWTSADGQHVAFAQSSYDQHYRGKIHSDIALSDDGGATWRSVRVGTGDRQPDCTSRGCPDGFYGPTPALAGDPDGTLVYAFAANHDPGAPQRVYLTVSTDGGDTWAKAIAVSPERANAIFPAATSGGPDDFRVWWMDTRSGRWNVWYTRTTDGGATWSHAVRLSNAVSGLPYKSRRGFAEAYGDYGEIDVTNTGRTLAIWGEGASYAGPGNVWFTRER
jgi:hypothetical protein